MIRHQCERKKFDRVFLQAFIKNSNESIVILRLLEDRLAVVSAIERMINDPSFVRSFLPRHCSTLARAAKSKPAFCHSCRLETTPVTFCVLHLLCPETRYQRCWPGKPLIRFSSSTQPLAFQTLRPKRCQFSLPGSAALASIHCMASLAS